MSFTNYNWTCISGSLNQGQQYVDGVILNAPNIFTYKSTDALGTITSPNYFLSKYQDLKVGDIIQGSAVDGYFDLQVTSSTSQSVTVVNRFVSVSLLPNRAVITDNNGNIAVSVTTALEISYVHGVTSNIQDQLDALLTPFLPQNEIFIGNPSNVATAATMSGDATLAYPGILTLATVNSGPGNYGSSTFIPSFTVNEKGLIIDITSNVVIAPAGTLTGTTLAPNVLTSSLTTVGTLMSGTWHATIISPTYGGTGINNGSNTLTLGGATVFSGAFPVTFTFTGSTSVTFPTSGTLATVSGTTITGTAHQVLVNGTSGSAQTGPFTLTTPQNIDTSSTPQFAGIGIGTAASTSGIILASAQQAIFGGTSFASTVNFEFDQTNTFSTFMLWGGSSATFNASSQAFGLLTQQTVAPTSGKLLYENINLNFLVNTSSAAITTVNAFHAAPRLTGSNNITTWRNIYGGATLNASYTGTLTDHYTAYFERPTFGTNKITAYFESVVGINVKPINTFDVAGGVAIGSYAGVNTPPTNGLIVSGNTLLGTTTDDGAHKLQVSGGALSDTLTLSTPLSGASGGTGVSNSGKTITLGGNLTTSGAFASTFTMTNTTSVTFPTSGTLATTAGTVASATGTANQVLVNGTSGSAQTGACTFTTPQDIGTASTVQFGILSINSGAISNVRFTLTGATSDKYGFNSTGTLTANDGSNTIGIYNNFALSPSANNKNCYGIYNGVIVNPSGTNTIPLASGADFTLGGTVGSGAVTNSFAGRFFAPTIGTSKVALYADNILVGYSGGITPATNSVYIAGVVAIGTSSPTANTRFSITGASTDKYGILLNGTLNGDDGFSTAGLYNVFGLSPSTNNINCYGILNIPYFAPVSTNTIPYASGADFYCSGTAGSGTVTNAFSIRIFAPTVGTNRTACYADNITVGYANVTPPTNGLQVYGVSTFGNSSAYINDGAIPAQINALANTERYFAVNKAGNYGVLIGYSNNGFNPGAGAVTAAIYRLQNAEDHIFYTSSVTEVGRLKSNGDIQSAIGNLKVLTAGKTLYLPGTTNGACGTISLVGGGATVSNTSVTASSIILYARQVPAGTTGNLSCTQIAGTGFTIASTSGTETSLIAYAIIEPS